MPEMSDLELRVFQAELSVGWKQEQIALQVPIRGGRTEKGGLVLDQVLYTPFPLPVMINGEYWHRDGSQEFYELAIIWDEFGREPVVIWGNEIPTFEQARAIVVQRIGRP